MLKIDKQLNNMYICTKLTSTLIKEAILADLKATRQFKSKSFAQISVNKSNGLIALKALKALKA